MHDEPGPVLTTEIQNEQPATNGLNPVHDAPSEQPKTWGRIDRTRLLIWAGIAFGVPFTLMYVFHLGGGRNARVLSVQSELPIKAVMVFFVLLATWIVSHTEKRLLDDYGIPLRKAFGGRFWEGAAWGFAMLSAILLALWALGHFRIDSVELSGAAVYRSALAWFATFLAVSLTEELAFRGYWLFSMSRRVRFWPAALFLSVIFAVAHIGNHGENVLGILQVFVTGLLFCLTIRRTGTLWFAIGFHASWDWAETFFYGTPDSGLLGVGRFLNSSVRGPDWLTGGSAGPEGSIFAIVILLLCAGLIHLRFPEAIYPDRPA